MISRDLEMVFNRAVEEVLYPAMEDYTLDIWR